MDISEHNFITNPLGVVQSAFETAVAKDPEAAVMAEHWGEIPLFNRFLFKGGRAQVPFLNSKSVGLLQPDTLVRYRGMILDDQPGRESYHVAVEVGGVWRTGKYRDSPTYFPEDDEPNVYYRRRRLFCCVPVPGQNDWTVPSRPCMNLKALGDANKLQEGGTATSTISLQGVPAEAISSMTLVTSEVDIENLPCVVKIYASADSDFELNEVFDFVGILSFDQFPGNLKLDPPHDKAPRIHCLVHKKLKLSNFLPQQASRQPDPLIVKPARETLLAHLTALLGNDDVAAQFMLLHLLSSVRDKKDKITGGKLELNLTSLTNERLSVFKNRILSILKHLLPFSHDLPPLTAELLNAGHLAPQKDNESIRVPGVLQLANESHLTIDETQLKAGSLNSIGKRNVDVLRSLLECQKLDYNYSNHKKGVPTDVQLLILSEGNSDIFPADLVLPLCPSSVDSPETPTADSLAAWRGYLATMRFLDHSIDPQLNKVVTDETTAASEIDPSSARRMLIMAALVSFSFGETSLSMEHWEMVKELERVRTERLQGVKRKRSDLLEQESLRTERLQGVKRKT